MTTTSRTFSHRCRAWSALAGLAGLFRTLAGGLGDHYRPELHYMRGPAPSGAPSIGRRSESAFPLPPSGLLPGRPQGRCIRSEPGSAEPGGRPRRTIFARL